MSQHVSLSSSSSSDNDDDSLSLITCAGSLTIIILQTLFILLPHLYVPDIEWITGGAKYCPPGSKAYGHLKKGSIVRSTISMHSMQMLGGLKYLKIDALRLNLRPFLSQNICM